MIRISLASVKTTMIQQMDRNLEAEMIHQMDSCLEALM